MLIHRFSNGLSLAYLPWNTPVAHTGIFIATGSRYETENEQGIAHFIEHTLFKGTEKRSSTEVIQRLESVGGELNAYTGREETVIHASFLVEHTDRALELISDIIFHATFPEKELEKEKEVVIDEINSYLDSPDEFIFDDFEEQLYKDQSFGRNILGTPEHVHGFTQFNIRRFIQRNYSSENMVISYVGNKSFDNIRQLVEKYFINNIYPNIQRSIKKAFINNTFKNTLQKSVYQSHCVLGGSAPSVKDSDYWAMSLLNNYIGGPAMNSVLNIALREKHGYTYSNESNFSAFSDTGIFEIYLATDSKTLYKCLKIIEKELKKLVEMNERTLLRIQNQTCGQIAIASDSGLNQMLSMGRSMLQTGTVLSMKEVFGKIKEVTLNDLVQVATKYMNFDNLNFLIYEPDENK